MIDKIENMIMLTLLGKFLKVCFWYGIVISGATVVEQKLTDHETFALIFESTPSIILTSFGVVWIVARALREISNTWFAHEKNRLDLKQEREHLKQERLTTEKQDKELND